MSAPVFTARDGMVLRRGVYLEWPSEMLARLEVVADDPADYFHTRAAELACELRDAITVAEETNPERSAA